MADSTLERETSNYRTTQGQQQATATDMDPRADLGDYMKDYARQKP